MEEKRYESIIRQYSAILAFISRYLVILSALVIAFFVFKKICLDSTYIIQQEDPFVLKKIELIGKFENMLKQAQLGTDIQAQIIQWPLQNNNQVILSQDNLITYRGIVTPRFLSLDTAQVDLKPLSYFSSPRYSSGELDRLISAVILNDYITLPAVTKNTQLPVDTSLAKSFNLACVFTNKLYQSTCDYYIQNFLSSFFVFNLSLDYAELTDIFSRLQGNPKHIATFCTNLQKYLLYTNDANQEIKQLFDQCGQETKDFFKKMENFIGIQDQLEQWFVNADVYKDPYLNAYKLLSYQQILYHDMQNNRVLYNQYTMYLTFLKELLKFPDKLDHFYYDEMYRFSTYYLKPALQWTRYESRIGGIKDEQINAIIKLIDTINDGDNLGEFSGLSLQVQNKSILLIAHTSSGTLTDIPLQEKILKKLKYISYLEEDAPSIRNNQVSISGSFILGDTKIATNLLLTYQDDTFYIRSITLPKYPRLLEALKILFTNKKVSLGDLYSAITKNFAFYQTDDVVASGAISSLCIDLAALQQTLSLSINACSPDHLVIDKTFSTASWSQDVRYTFFLNNYIINSISVSDPILQKNINAAVSVDPSRPLGWLITDVVNVPLRITVQATWHEGTANMISVLESFQKYFNIKPNDVAEKSWKILVDYTIKDIPFLAYYKANTHVLEPIYFKSVGAAWVALLIQGLGFTLDDIHRDAINLFLSDPLNYIKAVDATAWRNYVDPASSN